MKERGFSVNGGWRGVDVTFELGEWTAPHGGGRTVLQNGASGAQVNVAGSINPKGLADVSHGTIIMVGMTPDDKRRDVGLHWSTGL